MSVILILTAISFFFFFLDTIFHLDVHYVCTLVQRFEPQGRRFDKFPLLLSGDASYVLLVKICLEIFFKFLTFSFTPYFWDMCGDCFQKM